MLHNRENRVIEDKRNFDTVQFIPMKLIIQIFTLTYLRAQN